MTQRCFVFLKKHKQTNFSFQTNLRVTEKLQKLLDSLTSPAHPTSPHISTLHSLGIMVTLIYPPSGKASGSSARRHRYGQVCLAAVCLTQTEGLMSKWMNALRCFRTASRHTTVNKLNAKRITLRK